MKYYLEKDPLAQKVAKWAFPIFNPWRDFPDLYKAYRKKYIGNTDPRYKYIDL